MAEASGQAVQPQKAAVWLAIPGLPPEHPLLPPHNDRAATAFSPFTPSPSSGRMIEGRGDPCSNAGHLSVCSTQKA
eukprot:1365221-Pleurochrysis_carterae.AAC.1